MIRPFLFIFFVFISCKTKRVVSQYKLLNREGSGYVLDTSIMKIYSNEKFAVVRNNTVAYRGEIGKQHDTLVFTIEDGRKLFGVFKDASNDTLELLRHAVFVKIE
jgi:hypothetical protein